MKRRIQKFGYVLKKESMILLLLAFLQFVNIVDFMIMMPLGDELMRLFSITPAQFSLIVSSYTIAAGISGFLVSFLIDRFDRKRAMLFIFSGFTLGTFACGMADSYQLLLAARMFTGVFGGVIGALTLSIVSDIIPVERRATAMGILTASFSVASVAGVPGSLWIANMYNWQAPFITLAAIGCILLIMVYFILPNLREHLDNGLARRTPKEILTTLKNAPNQQQALLFASLIIIGQFTIIPFITPYMIRNVGFQASEIPLIYFVGGGLTIFTAPLFGKLSDKYGRKKIFAIAAILSIIPLFAITHLPAVPIYIALIATGLFFITINGRMIPAMALMTSMVRPENRGSFMSLSSSVQQLGAGIASYIAGVIVVQNQDGVLSNYNIVGYLAIGFTIIALYLSRKLKPIEGN